MNEQELFNIGILQWPAIQGQINHPSLLLGNGFSIGLSPQFNYRSLFANFLQRTNEPFTTLFSRFNTTNFEEILSYLENSVIVNQVLGLPIDEVIAAIEMLKNGLIESINEIHPVANDIDWGRLDEITVALDQFGDIYTTNYDLYLYHIIMKSNDRWQADNTIRPYQDYYWGTWNDDFKMFMGYQGYQRYKHVYYLHGALSLFENSIYNLKIKKRRLDNTELIALISDQILANNFPLFVTEGTHQNKLSSIYRSHYLNFCLESLATDNNDLVVFGNSLSEFDSHLVDTIKRTRRRLIFAIYPDGRNEPNLQLQIADIRNKFQNIQPNELVFVDARSIF